MDKITSPIYLLKAQTSCWRCGKAQKVVGLMAQYHEWVEEDHAAGRFESEMALLSYVEFIPGKILQTLQEHQPGYVVRHSLTADDDYYVNTCECGAFFGDFYLYDEPHGAFHPLDADEASRIAYRQLPFEGELDIECLGSGGHVDLILQHGTKLAYEAGRGSWRERGGTCTHGRRRCAG